MADNIVKLFGFEISRSKNKETSNNIVSFVPPSSDDGAITVSSAAHYGTYVDLDGSTAKNDIELITRYREMAMQPELESAIDDIVDESIVEDEDGNIVDIILDNLKDVPDSIKKKVESEFITIKKLLNFNKMAQEIYRRWYIDGRLNYNILLDKDNPQSGIQELRYIDPRKIHKVREIKKIQDPTTNSDVVEVANEFYIYNDKVQATGPSGSNSIPGVKIAKDSIIYVNSGLMDARRATVLSYLHKAIKPLNQLRMIEDATVIYRISRAPERRIWYIDVGNLPKMKAEQYLNDIMTKYRNKLVYDNQTGQVRDDRKNLSMLEDIWLPRREGGKGTEIDTLSGGENLGVMEDVIYFEKKLYKSLGVPTARLNPQDGFSLGRDTEITRDELKFQKFVNRLRSRFSDLFDQALRVQLSVKGICSVEDWEDWKEHIKYRFTKDNYFTELKEIEITKERVALISLLDPYTGRYFSEDHIFRKVLRMDDEEIKKLKKQIKKEGSDLVLQQSQQNDVAQPMDQQQADEIIDPIDQDINNQVAKLRL